VRALGVGLKNVSLPRNKNAPREKEVRKPGRQADDLRRMSFLLPGRLVMPYQALPNSALHQYCIKDKQIKFCGQYFFQDLPGNIVHNSDGMYFFS